MECAHRVGNYWEPIETPSDVDALPDAAGGRGRVSPLRLFGPQPRLVAATASGGGARAVAAAVAVGHPSRVRDLAAVGMIRLAGPAAAIPVAEIPTLDEIPGMRWAHPEDTPGRIGPFNPGIRRDRSGP